MREKQVLFIFSSFFFSCTNTHSTYYALQLMEMFNTCRISKISRQVKTEPQLDPEKRDLNFRGSHIHEGFTQVLLFSNCIPPLGAKETCPRKAYPLAPCQTMLWEWKTLKFPAQIPLSDFQCLLRPPSRACPPNNWPNWYTRFQCGQWLLIGGSGRVILDRTWTCKLHNVHVCEAPPRTGGSRDEKRKGGSQV